MYINASSVKWLALLRKVVLALIFWFNKTFVLDKSVNGIVYTLNSKTNNHYTSSSNITSIQSQMLQIATAYIKQHKVVSI